MKYKKQLMILVIILVTVFTTSGTFSYFNSTLSLNEMGVSSDASKLNITNGNIDLDFSKENIKWVKSSTSSDGDIVEKTQEDGSTEYEYTVGYSNPVAMYGPVKLNNKSTLTSNIDLAIQFGIGRIDTSAQEQKSIEPFEVMVGDIDNFNKGLDDLSDGLKSKYSNYNVYSGSMSAWHNMDVFPKAYDAVGTDRRMVPSGFYSVIKKLYEDNGKSIESTDIRDDMVGNGNWGTIFTKLNWKKTEDKTWQLNYDQSAPYYSAVLSKETTITNFGKTVTLPKDYPLTYEGYTDRALRSTHNDGNVMNNTDYKYDNKNWRYIQEVQPITFKYELTNEELNNGKINSAILQIYFDDLQSGDSVTTNDIEYKTLTWDELGKLNGESDAQTMSDPFALRRFVVESTSRFKVYLGVKGSSSRIEIPEMSEIVNSFNQSGPRGNIVTLQIPSEYLYLIKDAAGLNKGLEVTIDDTRIGTSGDSYCIDFAKLTVNTPTVTGKKISISGTVKDDRGDIVTSGQVMAGDGSSANINSNGTFTLNEVSPGIVYLTAKSNGYQKTKVSLGNVDTNKSDVEIVMKKFDQNEMLKVTTDIVPENYESLTEGDLELTTDEQNYIESKKIVSFSVDGEVKKAIETVFKPITYGGTSYTQVQQYCAVSPKSSYELYYKLEFASKESMQNYASSEITFNSVVKAKATQENNLGWNEDGTGEAYKPEYVMGEGTSTGNNSGNEDGYLGNYTDTKIYFEIPQTTSDETCGANWWSKIPKIEVTNNDNAKTELSTSAVNDKYDWYVGSQDNLDLKMASLKVTETNQELGSSSSQTEEDVGVKIYLHKDWINANLEIKLFTDKQNWQQIGETHNYDYYSPVTTGESEYPIYITIPASIKPKDTEIIFKFGGWTNTGIVLEKGVKAIYPTGGEGKRVTETYSNYNSGGSSSTGERTSGNLYYFSTKRIYICTN